MAEALVVGGGVAGLAAAVGLVRCGWAVRVLDRAAGWADAGSAISLAPNGLRALDVLDADLGAAVRAAAAPQWSGATRRPDRSVLAPFDGRRMARVLGDTLHALPRAELHRLLLDALPAGTVETTTPVAGADVATGRVHRADTSSEQADLVVAADGVGSALRGSVVPGAPAPRPSGYAVTRAIVADPGVEEDFCLTWGPGVEAGHIRLPGGRVEWHLQVRGPARDADARVAHWHSPLPELLAATAPGAALRHEVRVLPRPLPRTVAGRVVLVGDAAHPVVPNLGQGGCQALEDAAVLAACLAPAPLDAHALGAALARHEALRRPRTRTVARAARAAARIGLTSHPVTIALRDAALTHTPWRVAERIGLAPLRWDPPDRSARPPGGTDDLL